MHGSFNCIQYIYCRIKSFLHSLNISLHKVCHSQITFPNKIQILWCTGLAGTTRKNPYQIVIIGHTESGLSAAPQNTQYGSITTTSKVSLWKRHNYYTVVHKSFITRAPPVTGTLNIADSRASMQPFNAFECSSSINSQSSKWVACKKHPSLT